MGLLTNDKVLKWDDHKKYIYQYKKLGIKQFIYLFNLHKDNQSTSFFWGYEMEYMLVKKINNSYKLNIIGSEIIDIFSIKGETCWLPEYANWMIEKIPDKPFTNNIYELLKIEDNIKNEIKLLNSVLGKNTYAIMLTSFPQTGVGNFYSESNINIKYNNFSLSRCVPDNIINPHIRFRTLTENIRKRRKRKVDIKIPIYKDKFTKEETINMDCMAFGMGSCCTQLTIQCKNLDESLFIYDQFAILSPILLALSSASPIYKGKLSGHNNRWNVIEQAVDDRRENENVKKSRYSTISHFVHSKGQSFNDINLDYDNEFYNTLLKHDIPINIAKHIANLFIRDPIIMYEKDIVDIKNNNDNYHNFFVNINSSNWNNVRLKPPLNLYDSWKVEIRSLDMQYSVFSNTSFFIFTILLARTIVYYNLDFYIPISEVDNNFEKAKKNNCLDEKYIFILNNIKSASTIEIIIDKLIEYIYNYLIDIDVDISLFSKYLENIRLIASKKIKSNADNIRNFVKNHSSYNQDSVVHQNISDDLLDKIINNNISKFR